MDINAELHFHRPHLPVAVRKELSRTLTDVASATADFLAAANDFSERPDARNRERAIIASRMAWTLLLPSRREVLRTDRAVVERFKQGVERLLQFVTTKAIEHPEAFEQFVSDLQRRKSLLEAVLEPNSETRIRQLFLADRLAADRD